MNELNTIVGILLGMMVGMLLAFGLVAVFVFIANSDQTCRDAFITLLHRI